MTVYEIFSHSDRFHYRASLFSFATCFLIICAALTFLPPFLLTYFAGGFWVKEAQFVEQARINSSLKYLIVIDNNDVTTNRYFTSSYAILNQNFRSILLPGSATLSMADSDGDTKTDRLTFTTDILFERADIVIRSVQVWLIFQYELHARQRIIMESMVLAQLTPPSSGATSGDQLVANVVGDVVFQQRQPIQSSGIDNRYDRSIIDAADFSTASPMDLNQILDKYFQRNYFTTYENQYVTWHRSLSAVTGKLNLTLTMNIAEQSIRFIPGFWQEFKWGWIQYFSALLPLIVIFNRFKEFVFRNQIVKTSVQLPQHRRKH